MSVSDLEVGPDGPGGRPRPVFRRVLLKLSGEGLCRPGEGGIDHEVLEAIAREVAEVAARTGVQLAIVVGGGNILRGAAFTKDSNLIREVTGHHMGMTATVINGLALRDALEAVGCPARILTAFRLDEIAEHYSRQRADEHLEFGRVVILGAGTGSPFVTTDTAATLRGIELECDVVLKATRVDGVYSADPEKDPQATKYDELTYEKVLSDNLKVMDLAAIGMASENEMAILVFNFKESGNIARAVMGDPIGTWVSDRPRPLRGR